MESITRRDFVRNSMTAGAAVATVAAPAAAAESAPAEGAIKIVAISCSPRPGKTTAAALGVCLQAAKEVSPRIETELIELAGLRIDGSVAAGVPSTPGSSQSWPIPGFGVSSSARRSTSAT